MSTRRGSKNTSSQDFDPTPSLGKTIQRLRKAYNMSLGDLSEHSGVAKSIISQIERNETNPTLSTVYRLSRALDTTIDEVLRTEGAALFLEHQSKSGVPIQPVRIRGAREALPRGSGRIRFSRITVTVGPPIVLTPEERESAKGKADYDRIAKRIMAAIEAL